MAGTVRIYDNPNHQVALGGRNTIAVIGDSRVEAQYIDATQIRRSNKYFGNWADAHSNHRLENIYNGSNSGDRSDEYLASYLAGALASGAKWLSIFGVVNDIGQVGTTGDTAATIAARITGAADDAIEEGMNVILFTECGAESFSSSQIGIMSEYNQRIKQYVSETSGVILFDMQAACLDLTSSTIAFKTDYSDDGTHLNSYGSYFVGKEYADFIKANIEPAYIITVSEYDTPVNDGRQEVDNPLFTVTTGGNSNTGITGNTPAGYNSDCNNITTATVATVSEDVGNSFEYTITFDAQGDRVRLIQSMDLSNFNTGDVIEAGCVIEVDSGSSNLAGIEIFIDCAQAVPSGDLATADNTVALPTEAMSFEMKTKPYTLPAAIPFLAFQVRMIAAGVGSATIRIHKPWLRRLVE